MIKRCIETWFVDFYTGSNETWPNGSPKLGEHIETVEVHRANMPTQWAKRHVLTLRRRLQGKEVTFSIERVS